MLFKNKYKVLVFLMLAVFIFATIPVTYANQLSTAVSELNNPTTDAYTILQEIMSIMLWVGFIIAVFKVIQIGISFLTGSASKRSSAKDSILPWLVGAIICATFGSLGPWIISLFSNDSSIFD